MNNQTFEQIKLLVEDKMGKYKFPLERHIKLESDLGMSGDDAVEFLLDYGKKFKVDLSSFKMQEYFYPEGDSILPALIRLFTGKKNPKQKELTLGDLEKGAIVGKLDESVIEKNDVLE